jgi:hypothetical protein
MSSSGTKQNYRALEGLKEKLRPLYVDQKLTVNQVKEWMEIEHQFSAT